jgi:hypothetical protein
VALDLQSAILQSILICTYNLPLVWAISNRGAFHYAKWNLIIVVFIFHMSFHVRVSFMFVAERSKNKLDIAQVSNSILENQGVVILQVHFN